MSIRVVRLGSPRQPDEGTRLGTVRRPPRGVPKSEFARRDFYDVWFPLLAPSTPTMKLGLAGKHDDRQWAAFVRRYTAEMKEAAASQALDLLAGLSRHSNFSIGCYCEDEARCHRSLLRQLLRARGAKLETAPQ